MPFADGGGRVCVAADGGGGSDGNEEQVGMQSRERSLSFGKWRSEGGAGNHRGMRN